MQQEHPSGSAWGSCFAWWGMYSCSGLISLLSPGLVSFLIGQVAYIIGFNSPPPPSHYGDCSLAVIIGMSGARVVRRILSSIAEKGMLRMRLPVGVYGMVLSLMLLSAMLKSTDPFLGRGQLRTGGTGGLPSLPRRMSSWPGTSL